MEELIKLNSRYNTKNYLKKMKKSDGSDSKTYVLKTETPLIRGGWTDTKHKFIDPSGGPMIVEGSFLPEADAIVESINSIPGYGHTVTFK